METHFLDLDMKVPILCNKSSLLASFIVEVTFYKLLGCSTYALVFGCWELSNVIFLRMRKKYCKAEQILKISCIFTQKDNMGA